MKSFTSNRTLPLKACIYQGVTRTWNICEFCTPFIPVPGTSVRSVRPCHNTRGTGTAFLYLPRNCVSSVIPFFKPVPRPSVSSLRHSYPYQEFRLDLYARATKTEVRVEFSLYRPGTSVSSVRPCHNTGNFCEFCNTSIPVPDTSGSSVRLPYPSPV